MRLVFEIVDNVARESRAFPVGPVVGQVSNSRTNAGDEGKKRAALCIPLRWWSKSRGVKSPFHTGAARQSLTVRPTIIGYIPDVFSRVDVAVHARAPRTRS